jgi:hypothetical protein
MAGHLPTFDGLEVICAACGDELDGDPVKAMQHLAEHIANPRAVVDRAMPPTTTEMEGE